MYGSGVSKNAGPQGGHDHVQALFTSDGWRMKWRFSCHLCGEIYEIQHRQLHKTVFYTPEKKGRPTLGCVKCSTKVVGDLVGGRK